MEDLPRHRWFGTPLDEWANLVPNELETDAVGLWQFYAALQDSFGLRGESLRHWTKKIIESLIDRGSVPVDGISFELLEHLTVDSNPSIDRIMEHIDSLAGEPDFSGIWFQMSGRSGEQKQAYFQGPSATESPSKKISSGE